MKFHRHVTQEVRELLLEQLKEYEAITPMNKEERKTLHDWVASGRSPYDNGDYICGTGEVRQGRERMYDGCGPYVVHIEEHGSSGSAAGAAKERDLHEDL